MSSEPLEQPRLTPVDVEVMELHLRLGPGQSRRSPEGCHVPVFVYEVEDCLSC